MGCRVCLFLSSSRRDPLSFETLSHGKGRFRQGRGLAYDGPGHARTSPQYLSARNAECDPLTRRELRYRGSQSVFPPQKPFHTSLEMASQRLVGEEEASSL